MSGRKDLTAAMFIGVRGDGMISFGSGQPDLPPPKEVYQILPDYTGFKYGLIQGQENLRDALAKQYPRSTAESFVITNGASEALDLALRSIAWIQRGKGVQRPKCLLCRPYYYSYLPLVRYAGFEPVFTDLKDGRIVPEDFLEKVRDCKVVLINSPSNPTGRVEAIETLQAIEKATEELGVYILSDEVYKDLIYVRENYLIKGPHVVTINSFSKTFAMTGLRVGYLWSLDTELVKTVIEMKSHTSMNTSIIAQEMAYAATRVPKTYIDEQIRIWEARRDLIYKGMVDIGLDLWKPEGAFYVLPRIEDPEDFVWDMFHEHKIITYLGAWFGAPDRVRFSYALDVDKIEEGLHRVEQYLKTRRKG
ncbi:MAG TPA: pyridoxal phosphate-dependent aminotransferase [Deltaproteobacteria bacterium]|nr:pyridoxal phosphate-dependent aminotransferase [Deltaproteobacteria bacterium]HOI06167.1 pyridoxal phosphate-dependent aminotransferase [Deltaproteobacteria bacterium]